MRLKREGGRREEGREKEEKRMEGKNGEGTKRGEGREGRGKGIEGEREETGKEAKGKTREDKKKGNKRRKLRSTCLGVIERNVEAPTNSLARIRMRREEIHTIEDISYGVFHRSEPLQRASACLILRAVCRAAAAALHVSAWSKR